MQYEFQRQIVEEYRVEAQSLDEALTLLEEDPGSYLVDSYSTLDQEEFVFIGSHD